MNPWRLKPSMSCHRQAKDGNSSRRSMVSGASSLGTAMRFISSPVGRSRSNAIFPKWPRRPGEAHHHQPAWPARRRADPNADRALRPAAPARHRCPPPDGPLAFSVLINCLHRKTLVSSARHDLKAKLLIKIALVRPCHDPQGQPSAHPKALPGFRTGS